jgi:hypothetical protein
MSRCDVLFPSANVHTHINESLNCASVIDYMLTTNVNRTIAFNVLDIDINLSDHCPLLVVLNVCFSGNHASNENNECKPTNDVTYLWWDHSPLDQYYEYTRTKLQPVLDYLELLANNIDCDIIQYDCIIEAIDRIHTIVVDTLLLG